MNRKQKALRHVRREGFGLEIGPSHSPMASKKEGFRVDIVDHLPRAELVEKYKGHRLRFEDIEEVDFIWRGESYAELTGRRKHYDWIIASHVIEHTPDLIGFLTDCDQVLKDDGIVSLIVPDKRYCFDHFRPVTGLGLIPFQELDFFPTEGCEFHITLSRTGAGPGSSHLELLERIESELRDQSLPPLSRPKALLTRLKKIVADRFFR